MTWGCLSWCHLYCIAKAVTNVTAFILRKMTDKKWHEIISKCKAACDEHLRLLKIAEDEYFQRYGNAPSDVNDDWWIDTLHYGNGSTDLDLIKKAAEMRTDR